MQMDSRKKAQKAQGRDRGPRTDDGRRKDRSRGAGDRSREAEVGNHQ